MLGLYNHHHIEAEYSVINILSHMAKAVCYTPELLRTGKKTMLCYMS